jgi:hypothetical protein
MKLWIIRVDYDPIPYEDFSQALRIVRGTSEEVEIYIRDLQEKNEEWVYSAEPITEEGITEL